MDYSLQGSMKSFVFYNRKGNSHAGQVILIVFLVLLLMFTAVIIWAQNKPPVQLPSYYLSKKQYYDLMMDPTATKSILPTHVNFTQLERSYPTYFHLVDLLSKWPANDVSSSQWIESPAYPAGGNGLFRLNYMNPSERALAQSLRDRELPFVLFNIPELDNAADTDFAAKTLLRHLESERLIVERSLSNEFMYFLV